MPENPVRTRRTALHLLRTMHDALSLVESGLDVAATAPDHEAVDLIVKLRLHINRAFADLEDRAAVKPLELVPDQAASTGAAKQRESSG